MACARSPLRPHNNSDSRLCSDHRIWEEFHPTLLNTGGRYLQTVYGLIRYLNGSATAAFLAQGITAVSVAIILWLVWRARVRYALKTVTLSAAALVATPYAFAYDLAALATPVAFLARD